MNDFFYSESKTEFNVFELLAFSVLEALVIVWGFEAWLFYPDVYVRIALLYCWGSVVIQFVQHFVSFLFKFMEEFI